MKIWTVIPFRYSRIPKRFIQINVAFAPRRVQLHCADNMSGFQWNIFSVTRYTGITLGALGLLKLLNKFESTTVIFMVIKFSIQLPPNVIVKPFSFILIDNLIIVGWGYANNQMPACQMQSFLLFFLFKNKILFRSTFKYLREQMLSLLV